MKAQQMNSALFMTLLAVAAMASVTTTTDAAIIVMDAATANGSFTSPDVSGFQNGTAPTGWTAGGNIGNQGLQDGGVDGNQIVYWNAPSGSNGTDVLSRSGLYTVASAGEQVSMTYYVGGNASADKWILGAITLNGSSVASSGYTYVSSVPLGGTGSLQTLNYTTLAGDVGKALGVYFNFTGNSGAAQGQLDLVTVTVTPVPEPGSFAMLAFGSFAMLFLRRKRTR